MTPDTRRRSSSLFASSNVDVEGVDDLRKIRWEKLIWNIPFNGYGAALDLHTAALLRSEAGTTLVRETMHEVIRAGRSVGVDLREEMVEKLIATTHDAGDYRTSMHLDRLAGRAMEVDAIIAEPIRQAEANGCTDLPRMIALRDVLRAVDGAGRLI